MQKRPSTLYVPHTLSSKFPLMATLGNFGLFPFNPAAVHKFHDCAEFVYCHSGQGKFVSEGKEFPFQAGDVLFISPYLPHYLYKTMEQRCRCEFIHVNLTQMFDPEIFYDITEFTEELLVPFAIHPVIQKDQNPLFNEMIRLILKEMLERKPYFEMSIKGYCLSLVSELKLMWQDLREQQRGEEEKASIYPALIHMNRNYAKDITIPELAQLCHLSETHFRRLFKSKFAMSPLDYLNYIRIRESCILLSRKTLLISQAADLAGFRSLSSYNRKFLEVMKISPSQWVRQRLYAPENPDVIYYG